MALALHWKTYQRSCSAPGIHNFDSLSVLEPLILGAFSAHRRSFVVCAIVPNVTDVPSPAVQLQKRSRRRRKERGERKETGRMK
eukprot:9489118-Pyramimonas_sp.AAC.1